MKYLENDKILIEIYLKFKLSKYENFVETIIY